jgi:hypothetical protein
MIPFFKCLIFGHSWKKINLDKQRYFDSKGDFPYKTLTVITFRCDKCGSFKQKILKGLVDFD